MKTFGMSLMAGVSLLVSCGQLPLWAQASLPGEQRVNGKDFEATFEEQRLVLQKSSAVIYDGYKSIVYGVVMESNGWILTKASEIAEKKDQVVRVDQEKYEDVEVVLLNSEWDLALLKVDAENLTPVKWAESSKVIQGTWVVTNGSTSRSRRRLTVGIISAKAREIKGHSPVVMGITLEEVEEGLRIGEVSKDTGAEKAGLKKGDVITKFEGLPVLKREKLVDRVRDYSPGDKVNIEIKREDKTLKTELELMARHSAFETRESRNDQMSGDFSKRRDSFPNVLQTDLVLNSRTVGGPLVNLEGESLGMTIARANRAESFAIPVESLLEVYASLKSEAKGE